MSEVTLENDVQTTRNENEQEMTFDPVCVDVPRIYDSCGAKDCLRDLTVFFTAEDQAVVDTAASVRVTKASVLSATVSADAVAFHRGYYAVDVIFYFAVCAEVYTAAGALPTTVTGLATASKRAVLYGSDAGVKVFSSDSPDAPIDATDFDCCPGCSGTLPTATVQVSSPMVLASGVTPVTTPAILPFVPGNVTNFYGGALVAPIAQQVVVTLGTFSIIQLTRDVQLMIPSYDFCVPRKECDSRTDDPCEAFNKIEFPSDSFFPPSTTESEAAASSFGCGC